MLPLAQALAKLPPLPEVAMRVLRIARDDEGPLRRLADLIRSDPAFAGEILRLANSASMRGRAHIQSVQHALAMIGLERLKAIVMTVALRNFLGARLKVPVLRRCWRHSIATAASADEVAAACRWNRDVSYTAGLLHDVGRLGLLAAFPVEYAALLAEDSTDLRSRERELFGADHCEAGALIAEHWKFPAELHQVASHHHDPPPERFDLGASVQLACRLADLLGFPAGAVAPQIALEELLGEYRTCPVLPSKLAAELQRKIRNLEAEL